ncbi:hypothetical protein RFI_05526, partial [Reticulomyxa filosa]
GKQDYEAIMANSKLEVTDRKREVMQMAQEIMNRKGVNLFTFDVKTAEKFVKDLEIDDCDQPQPPILVVVKATFNSISIEWQMSHPSLALKVNEFGIEVARIRKDETKKKKSSKKSKKKKGKGKKKKKGSDDDSESDKSASESGSEEKLKKKKGADKDDEKKGKDKDLEDDLILENAEGDFTEEELMGIKWTEVGLLNKYVVIFFF